MGTTASVPDMNKVDNNLADSTVVVPINQDQTWIQGHRSKPVALILIKGLKNKSFKRLRHTHPMVVLNTNVAEHLKSRSKMRCMILGTRGLWATESKKRSIKGFRLMVAASEVLDHKRVLGKGASRQQVHRFLAIHP